MDAKIPSFLTNKQAVRAQKNKRGSLRTSFIDKTVRELAGVIKVSYLQWELASREGLFQKLDPRIKIVFLLAFVFIISLKKEIVPELFIGFFVLLLVIMSHLNIFSFYKKVSVFGFLFGFLVALPATFNIITRGEIILPVVRLSEPHQFWIYSIPREIGITREGLHGVLLLTSRVLNSVAVSLLVISTTSFPHIIKALKVFRIPDAFLMIITLSYKYIYIFAMVVEEMHLAKKSKLIRPPSNAEARKWIAGRMAFIFRKTQLRCEEVYRAMTARGFSNVIRLGGLGRITPRDWLAAFFLLSAGAVFVVI